MPTDPSTQTLVLSSGGLRSLVALALVREEQPRQRVTLLHVADGRASRKQAADAAARQAEALEADRTIELSIPHLQGRAMGSPTDRPAAPSLAGSQVLLAAVGAAMRHKIGRVVYPVSCGLEAEALGRATERVLLAEQLAAADVPPSAGDEPPAYPVPRVETPLLELTDPQVVEVAGQLGLDFTLAWSCLEEGSRPCQQCRACRRRKLAFDKAGLVDPLLNAATASAA